MRYFPLILILTLTFLNSCNHNGDMPENPFLVPSSLPFEAPDFDRIDESHFMPAFQKGIEEQLLEIEKIAQNSDEPSYENTIVAMEKSGQLLTRVQRVFFNLTSAHTNEKIQQIQAELAPKLAAHSDNILLNRDLFSRIESLYERRSELGLSPESMKLLTDRYRDFVRAGAQLDEDEQARMREINERVSTLTTKFQEQLLEMSRERAVVVDDESMLEGLSRDRIAAAAEAAASRGYEGKYLFSITNTTRQPVLTSLSNRDMRRKVWEASAFRGTGENGGIDTRPVVLELANLRAERATLLGYPSFAHFAIEPQTGENPERVLEMLEGLFPSVAENASAEAELIREMMQADGIDDELQPWDWEYYAEKVRQARYDIDDSEVRAYFELDRVLKDGVFYTMNRLYGITFEERNDLPVYHEDVRVFDVFDRDGSQLGLFYGDFFSRDSKRGGAWMNSFVVQSHLLDQKPVVVNVLNISPPATGEPALITFDNVTTLFHEMGHAVHGLFSDVNYPSQAGTSVPRDFVEFPSTFEEDWAVHPDVLANYAVHYETSEPIPSELLERVIAARDFNQGFDTYEYLAATMIDMEWHLLDDGNMPSDVEAFEAASLAKYGLNDPAIPPRYKSTYFAHIFSGGYSANYYAYIWSEVLAADAFAFMRERGGLTRENGDHYREHILSRGGSGEAMELYREFRGGEPDVRHLLRRRGLSTEP
jgi:peptidyl-dipeptidase Dcp